MTTASESFAAVRQALVTAENWIQESELSMPGSIATPVTGTMQFAQNHLKRLEADHEKLRAALQKAETWVATLSRQVDNPGGPLAADLEEIRAVLQKT